MNKSIIGVLSLVLAAQAKAAPAAKDAWVGEDAGIAFERVAQKTEAIGGRFAGQGFDPRASLLCKSVEYPVRTQDKDGLGWIDTRPKVAYSEWHSDSKRVGPSPGGKLYVCEDPDTNREALFGPPAKFDRFSDLPPAVQRLWTTEGFNDDIRLLARYPFPEVKKILTGQARDCYRAAARIAKAEDFRLHPDEFAMQDVYDLMTSYGRDGFKEKPQARFEGGNVVHPIQVIHERNSIHKYDDYEVTLNAASCGLVSIAPGKQVIVGWSHDGRRKARLEDFIGDPNRIPTPAAAELEVDRKKVPLPETPGAGAKALREGAAPAQRLIALFGRERVRAAFVEIDKLQVLRDTNREAYIALLDQHTGTLHQYIGSVCHLFENESHKERLIEADKDDSEPNLDLELSHKCWEQMVEIYPE